MNDIVYTSKMDKKFKRFFIGFATFLLLFMCALTFFDDAKITQTDLFVIIAVLAFIYAFILWLIIDIRYVFKEDHLYLRAGFIFTKINYADIERYRYFDGFLDAATGFNMVSASKGIGIHSQKTLLGEVKLSPSDLQGFARELDKRIEAAHTTKLQS